MLYVALHFSIPISSTSLTQQDLACYVIKLKSKSFRLWGSLCSGRKLLAQSAVSVCVKVKGQGEGQSLAKFSDLVGTLHCCANASESTANKAWLTAQAFPLSGASLSRQPVFGFFFFFFFFLGYRGIVHPLPDGKGTERT